MGAGGSNTVGRVLAPLGQTDGRTLLRTAGAMLRMHGPGIEKGRIQGSRRAPDRRGAEGSEGGAARLLARARRVGPGLGPPIRFGCLRSRPRPACRTWCRSATDECLRPVRVLPWRRLRHGVRSGGHSEFGITGPAVWRRPPVELRRLRGPRPPAGVRPQRLRRDAAGTVGVGREAAGGEPGCGRPTEELRAREQRRVVAEAVQRYREAMRQFAEMRNLEVWYSRIDVESRFAAIHDRLDRECRARAAQPGQGAAQGQPARVLEAHAPGGRRAAPDQRPAADRSPLGAPRRARSRRLRGCRRAHPPFCCAYRGTLRASCAICSRATATSTWRARSWASAAWAREPGSSSWVVTPRPLFLQVKEAQRSVMEPFARRSSFKNQGQRVVEGRRLGRPPATSCSAGFAPPAGRDRARLLRAPALGLESVGRGRRHGRNQLRALRRTVW